MEKRKEAKDWVKIEIRIVDTPKLKWFEKLILMTLICLEDDYVNEGEWFSVEKERLAYESDFKPKKLDKVLNSLTDKNLISKKQEGNLIQLRILRENFDNFFNSNLN